MLCVYGSQLLISHSAVSSHPSESEGSYWRRHGGIQFSGLDRKRVHCTAQTHKRPTYTSGKLSLRTQHYQFYCCSAKMQNSRFYRGKTPNPTPFTEKKQHREGWRPETLGKTLGYRLESDMADLVPGLLICLMAVQTIQHNGKFTILNWIYIF